MSATQPRPTATRAFRLVLGAALAIASSACAPLFGRARPAPSAQAWRAVRDSVKAASDSGRFAAADQLLADFAKRYPRSWEAGESAIWRALVRLDPANRTADAAGAIAVLDSLIATRPDTAHLQEALLARRVAQGVAGLSARADTLADQIARARDIIAGTREEKNAVAAQKNAATAQKSSLADEVQKLREDLARSNDQLAKANAELERVKKRLTTGKP